MQRYVVEYTINTGLHGAPFFKRGRYLLVLCAAACASFGLWECQKTFKTFLMYNVKTKVQQKDIEKTGMYLPAITFASAQQLQRTTAAGTRPLIMMMYTAAAGMPMERALEWEKTCYNPSITPIFATMETIMANYTYPELMQMGQIDSGYAVRQCSQNMKSFDCSRQFLNRLLDASFGFTFNPDPSVTEAYPLAERLPGKSAVFARAYGTTGPARMNFTSYLSGRRAGVQFVMRVDENDYCGALLGGQTGIMAVVHDPSAEPILLAKAYVMLGPGFVHNVALHMKKTERKTEFLGYCKSRLFLKYYNDTVDYVSKDKYIVNCLTDVIITRCNCIPYYAPPKTGVLMLGTVGNGYNADGGKLFACMSASTSCQLEQEKSELSLNGKCFHSMPKPCEETKFTTQVTSSILASPNNYKSLRRLMPLPGYPIANLSQFRQTFIIANFYMGSSTYLVATEQLAMTWVDLMNSLGGAVGMSVGMSLITLLEMSLFLLSSIRLQLNRLYNWQPPTFVRFRYFG